MPLGKLDSLYEYGDLLNDCGKNVLKNGSDSTCDHNNLRWDSSPNRGRKSRTTCTADGQPERLVRVVQCVDSKRAILDLRI